MYRPFFSLLLYFSRLSCHFFGEKFVGPILLRKALTSLEYRFFCSVISFRETWQPQLADSQAWLSSSHGYRPSLQNC